MANRPLWRTRFAALLIAHGGRVSTEQLRRLTVECGVTGQARKSDGSSNGTSAARIVRHRMAELVDDDLVKRDGDEFVAIDLAELGAFVADELEELDGRTHDEYPEMSHA